MTSCKGFVRGNFSHCTDNQLARKLRVAERNIREWKDRALAIQRELDRRRKEES